MKGLVFNEFLSMVDEGFSPGTRERLIQICDLPSAGSYANSGIYDPGEMTILSTGLFALTGVPQEKFQGELGRRLFRRFVEAHPQFVDGMVSAAEFLPHVHEGAHEEASRLYPGAEPPTIVCERPSPGVIVMRYRSAAYLPAVADGMIRGCIEHFGDDMTVEHRTAAGEPETVFTVRSAAAG